jgi:hypothetical protein
MYRFPSIASLINIRSTTPKSINLPCGSSQNFKAVSLPLPIPSTSSNEYRFPSIDIRNRSQEKHKSSRTLWARHLSHDIRPVFAFSRCSQQKDKSSDLFANVGTNLRRRSDSMLQRSFDSRNTFAACVPSRGAVLWGSSSLQSFKKHPLDANATLGQSAPRPANCWLLLAINLEPIPASLHHPA